MASEERLNDELPSRWLTRQHRQLDELLQQALAGTGDLARVRAGMDLLRLHLWVEEEILFGPVADTGLAMPIYIMQYEHAQMWPPLQELSAACDAGAAHEALCAPGRALYELFRAHNPKEEDLIYAVLDRVTAAGGLQGLQSVFRDAAVPEGWVCRGRRPGFRPPPGARPWTPAVGSAPL